MEGLINLIVYVIIIAAWVIRNIKKQGKWEAEIPRVPEHIPAPTAPEQKPEKQEPLREGDFADKPQARVNQDSGAISDDELSALLREKSQEPEKKTKPQIQKQPVLFIDEPDQKKPESKEYALITSEKETLYLKCKIEEGIIWSILLGPPRSKLRFNWKNSPIRR